MGLYGAPTWGWWQEQGAQQAIPWAQETEPSQAKSKSSVTFCVNSSCFTETDTCSLRVLSLCADTKSSAYNSQKSSGEVEAVAWSIDGNNRRGGDAVRHVRAVERGVELVQINLFWSLSPEKVT